MSEALDPRADETSCSPPEGSARETVAVDTSPPTTAVDAAAIAPTERMDPVERGSSVAEARDASSPGGGETLDMSAPSGGETMDTPAPSGGETMDTPAPSGGETMDTPAPGGGETMDMPSPGGNETIDVPPSVGSVGPGGGSATDAGSGAMPYFAGEAAGETTDQATPVPARVMVEPLPSGRRPGPPRPVLPGYEIIEEIGRGGMGVVYKARHVRLNRLVALKMILAGAHASDDQIARFHIEARAVAQIQHPGIVQIHEDGDYDGLPYFSLEFVPGGSLSQSIGSNPQPPPSAATMVMALCRAMAEAHSRGIIHRDLKPANVLLTIDGQPKITDFGLAKQMDADSGQTRSGAIMGTPSYMAPEQAWGQTQEIGPLSDQYALGAILYDMLVGRPPFQGASTLETLELARTQEPVPPTRLQPKVPIDLETICLKALQKDPAKRYPDAATMAEDLRRFLDGEPILARPVGSLERLWRWCKRNPRVAILAAAVLLLMIFTAVGSAAFAASMKALNGELETLNGKLAMSVDEETKARQIAQTNEKAAIEAREKEKQARQKAEALVQGAFAQNKNALDAHRTLSVLLNQRLLSIPGTQALREELIHTTLTGLEATIASLEQLGTVARDKEGFALATRTLTGINQSAGRIAMEYGKYDETARYFRRMEELARELAASDPNALEPVKVMAIVKATLADFQMYKMGDAEAALKLHDQALALRREWLAREPSNDEAKRGVANLLGAVARAQLQLGNPAAARQRYREEIELRDQLSPAVADQLEVRRERAGLEEKLGDLNLSLGDPKAGRECFERALRLRREMAAQNPELPETQHDVLLSLEKLGTHELIYSRNPGLARRHYQEALDGFLRRLEDEPASVPAKFSVALAHYYVATAALRAGDRDSAAAHYRACRDIRMELAKDPKTKLDSLDLMLALARTGDHQKASQIAESMIKVPPLDARIYFHAACGFALSAGAAASLPPSDESRRWVRHYTDRALDALRLAFKRGWRSAAEVATDPDLDPIRGDPGFAAVLDQFRKAAP